MEASRLPSHPYRGTSHSWWGVRERVSCVCERVCVCVLGGHLGEDACEKGVAEGPSACVRKALQARCGSRCSHVGDSECYLTSKVFQSSS